MPMISLGKSSKNELYKHSTVLQKQKEGKIHCEFHHSEKAILNN